MKVVIDQRGGILGLRARGETGGRVVTLVITIAEEKETISRNLSAEESERVTQLVSLLLERVGKPYFCCNF